MDKKLIVLSALTIPMIFNVAKQEFVASAYTIPEEQLSTMIEPRANIYVQSYRVENVTDSGFDFIIKLNSDKQINSLKLWYWKYGNYNGMKDITLTQQISYNEFKTNIKMRDIGSGTEYINIGVHPSTADGSQFVTNLSIKLDDVIPNLNLSLSNSNWTNQNIKINSVSTDNQNIVEKLSFYNKSGAKSTYDVYSNPNILVVQLHDYSSVAEYLKYYMGMDYLTVLKGSDLKYVSQLKNYDVVIVDGVYWNIGEDLSEIVNQAFEEGVSIITNMDDSPSLLSIATGTLNAHSGDYKFQGYNTGTGGFNTGRFNRFAYLMDGQIEGDGSYYEINKGTDTFIISSVKHADTGTVTPGVLMKTHLKGNKWIHSQTSYLFGSTGALSRAIDEIMHGTMKARQTYSKSFEVSENGTYYVESEDFSGNKNKKAITVTNIDKVAPVLSVSGNPTAWSKSATLQVRATDDLSGINQIILPNGSVVKGSTATFTTNINGNYQFKTIDNAGNETTKTINVTKVDSTIGNLSNIKVDMEMVNPSESNRKVNATFNALTDSQSGIKGYSYVIDKNPSTIPSDIVNTTTTTITSNVTDKGAYYIHLKAIDNADNISNVIHQKIDIPTLSSVAKPSENLIRLDWTMDDIANKTFKVYQKKPGSNDFQSISSTDFTKTKQVKVLNLHPDVGETISYTTWDGEVITDSKSASLKEWMEKPNSENPKGYGKGIIEVAPVPLYKFNANPNSYLKNSDGSWKYDVIMIGSWDANSLADVSDTAVVMIKDFIEDGKGILFGHDTIGYLEQIPNIRSLSPYLKMQPVGGTYYNGYNDKYETPPSLDVISNISIYKKGLLTNYPWSVGEVGDKLQVPATHTLEQIANGDIWMKFNYNDFGIEDKANFYLTTWNNTAMIQTGHASGRATSDEQKLLANTLFYLNQLSSDNFLNDNSGQDITAPNKPTVNSYSFNKNIVNIIINNTIDNGSAYEYYVQSEIKNGSDNTISNVSKETITSGFKGYSYVVDTNATTIPDNKIETNYSNILINMNNKTVYVHIKAIDNANNESETLHYKVEDVVPPTLSISGNPTSWTNQNVTLTATGTDTLTGVKEIVLPNGSIVSGSSATFIVTNNGNYTFKIRDNVGNETSQTVSVTKIDKTLPTLSISGNPTSWTNQNVTLTATGNDTLSGVKEVVLPNGSIVSGSSANYTATANGNYTFKIRDIAGNEVSQTVSVTKIDKTLPTLSISGNPTSWTNQNVTLTATGSDTLSGVKEIILPDGTIKTGSSSTFTVTDNGNYTFKIRDNAGNENTQTVSVTKIDKMGPDIVVSYNNNYTNREILLNISAIDNLSGVKQIILPNGNIIIGTSATYTVYKNGIYTIKAIDNLDNISIKTILIDTIDVKKPSVVITNNKEWINKDVNVSITATDE